MAWVTKERMNNVWGTQYRDAPVSQRHWQNNAQSCDLLAILYRVNCKRLNSVASHATRNTKMALPSLLNYYANFPSLRRRGLEWICPCAHRTPPHSVGRGKWFTRLKLSLVQERIRKWQTSQLLCWVTLPHGSKKEYLSSLLACFSLVCLNHCNHVPEDLLGPCLQNFSYIIVDHNQSLPRWLYHHHSNH